MSNRTVITSLTLPTNLVAVLDSVAARERRSRSALVRNLLEDSLSNWRADLDGPPVPRSGCGDPTGARGVVPSPRVPEDHNR